MSRWWRFCAKLFHPREHEDKPRKTSTCGCQHSTIPKMIRVNEESSLHQYRSRESINMYCTENELESLVGLAIQEDAWSVTDDGNDIASTSSLDYSDALVDVSSLEDTMIEPVVCVGKTTAADESSVQPKYQERLDVSIGTANTVEITRITI